VTFTEVELNYQLSRVSRPQLSRTVESLGVESRGVTMAVSRMTITVPITAITGSSASYAQNRGTKFYSLSVT
jgi:hypothetical protein